MHGHPVSVAWQCTVKGFNTAGQCHNPGVDTPWAQPTHLPQISLGPDV